MSVRVRFAPSPTGTLHIGGVRTALYNYLFARQQGGTFVLRIEDTDRTRYDEGAEAYIFEALEWLGMTPDEGPHNRPNYRQSERHEAGLYKKYADQLIANGKAYYAFDTEETLGALRTELEKNGKTFKYDASSRMGLRNSLSLPAEEVKALMDAGTPYVVRLKVDADQKVTFYDEVRHEVSFSTNELDDKVMLKADGWPTYHLANVVDDHDMAITHVIRGEEWLPSTPVHVLLYQAFGWESTMPKFVHLPLILKPNGKGKLGKRDGAELGIPVFPLQREDPRTGQVFSGFRENGYLPQATLNFLALLGWNEGTDKEIYSREELIAAFSLPKVGNSGARFDIQKAQWFNQQYMLQLPESEWIALARKALSEKGQQPSDEYMAIYCQLFRERVIFPHEFWEKSYYLFQDIQEYDQDAIEKKVKKKWDAVRADYFLKLNGTLQTLIPYDAESIKACVEGFIAENGLGFGDVLPVLRLATSGTLQGPTVFDIMAVLGQQTTHNRLETFIKML